MKLAVFDLDDTLISGDCASLWCDYLYQQGVIDARFLAREQQLMQRYRQGELHMADYMQLFLQPLRYKNTRQVYSWVAEFLRCMILHRVRPQAMAQINQHQARGDQIVVVSGSAHFLVQPIAELMGVRDTLSVQCRTYKGRFTGETQGILSFGAGKALRLKHWLDSQKAQPQSIAFYSDSIKDLPLLELSDQPFAVNPDADLALLAKQRGWSVLNW